MREGSVYEAGADRVDRRNRAERPRRGLCLGAQQAAVLGAIPRPELRRVRRGWRAIAAAALALFAAPLAAHAQTAPEVELWRLDCGDLDVSDFAEFSDTHRYDGKPYKLVDSCYLIRHGSDYLLWDTGLGGDILGQQVVDGVFTLTLKSRLVPQLAQIGVKPGQVRFVGISHRHFDHIGQLGDFPRATLLIGAGDFAAIKADNPKAAGLFKPWLDGTSKVEAVAGDKDVFGDGSVVMLAMPGHTPGHHALLVRLKGAGPVLLSGDQFHATESFEHDQVPVFNTDRADTLASIVRFKQIAANLKAKVVIQHEPADVAKLPLFPRSAR
ncbi:glyoxylase-like metal-dependent hydrolase (beta-lactamase superfamily II) [Sphingomonas naasensis]|uniref:N-acyl homoserine lactonase family protein n=1 Tax=Sphingomonas naasensis TaxID=1344951 RepID=A0A4S1W8R7_9SPHN|nr:N-acyl homoserine lactonase family protein [Sphingomonas naasensis]NIJ19417.1 glyoxylase-like metal-dependent hydrolase (beta-lactamase superfamily II) [Sphingomonas naasensis]TGX39159.1 N-acyl homoserine lactonase family protein [Sphingomonas naasensis]